MKRIVLAGIVLASLGTVALAESPAVTDPAGHTGGDEAAVLAAMDRYLTAISANDLDSIASLQTPDGTTYRARAQDGGGMEVVGRPNSYWVDPARKDGRSYRERYRASTRSASSRSTRSGASLMQCGRWNQTIAPV